MTSSSPPLSLSSVSSSSSLAGLLLSPTQTIIARLALVIEKLRPFVDLSSLCHECNQLRRKYIDIANELQYNVGINTILARGTELANHFNRTLKSIARVLDNFEAEIDEYIEVGAGTVVQIEEVRDAREQLTGWTSKLIVSANAAARLQDAINHNGAYQETGKSDGSAPSEHDQSDKNLDAHVNDILIVLDDVPSTESSRESFVKPVGGHPEEPAPSPGAQSPSFGGRSPSPSIRGSRPPSHGGSTVYRADSSRPSFLPHSLLSRRISPKIPNIPELPTQVPAEAPGDIPDHFPPVPEGRDMTRPTIAVPNVPVPPSIIPGYQTPIQPPTFQPPTSSPVRRTIYNFFLRDVASFSVSQDPHAYQPPRRYSLVRRDSQTYGDGVYINWLREPFGVLEETKRITHVTIPIISHSDVDTVSYIEQWLKKLTTSSSKRPAFRNGAVQLQGVVSNTEVESPVQVDLVTLRKKHALEKAFRGWTIDQSDIPFAILAFDIDKAQSLDDLVWKLEAEGRTIIPTIRYIVVGFGPTAGSIRPGHQDKISQKDLERWAATIDLNSRRTSRFNSRDMISRGRGYAAACRMRAWAYMECSRGSEGDLDQIFTAIIGNSTAVLHSDEEASFPHEFSKA